MMRSNTGSTILTTCSTTTFVLAMLLLPLVFISLQYQQLQECHAYIIITPIIQPPLSHHHQQWTITTTTTRPATTAATTTTNTKPLYLSSASSSEESDPSSSSSSSSSFSSSRLYGNQRQPTQSEVEIMDEMIYKLIDVKPYDLPIIVQRAYRVISSPKFFVRIAELVDQYENNDDNDENKLKLMTLADNLVSTLDAVVSTAQDKMQETTQDVERIIQAAAEPESGEFLVPLSIERLNAMRHVMNTMDVSSFDNDVFLSTIDAYMNKSSKDGLDLMVIILQNVLQLYAGRRIYEARKLQVLQKGITGESVSSTTTATTATVGELLDELLQTDSDRWDSTIRNGIVRRTAVADTTTTNTIPSPTTTTLADELIIEIQKNMETIILSLESGSMSQRIQAEYLQELVKRIEQVKLTL